MRSPDWSPADTRLQEVVQGLEGLWNNVYVREHGHEIRVAIPPRNDVPVKVARKSCPGNFSQVQSDVESIGRHRSAEYRGHFPQILRAFEQFGIAQLSKVSLVGIWGNQQVPVVVGKPVQDNTAGVAPQEDEILAILLGMIPVFTQKTMARCRSIGRLDVAESPRCPESVVRHGPEKSVPLGRKGIRRSLHDGLRDDRNRNISKFADGRAEVCMDSQHTGQAASVCHGVGMDRVGIRGGEED